MASSDDEGEAVLQSVSNYHFVDEKDEPVSFSVLPIQWSEGESPGCQKEQIFLHGTADNGLQKIYKQVTAWKFDLSDVKPEISALSKENSWIKLQKPRKSFEDTIRTILITVHCLHFIKKNPETSGKSLWDHLSKVFSLYEVRPSENDLVDHMPLISEAVKRDETLAKSKFLPAFLEDKPRKRKAFDEDVKTAAMPGFIVDDDLDEDMIDVTEEDGSDEEEDLFDSVCAICDNGGEILGCEGRCLRSFHATVDAGAESKCQSLGLSEDQVEAIQNFFCKNCHYKQHQCFSCGKLGSSDKSSGAEVFPCVSATCGHFYHTQCVAKLLHGEDEVAAEEFQKKIAAGESFTCPIHKCHVCKQGENKDDPELQFAVCRRCPRSYHRKCLPRRISFEDLEDEGIIQRAWEDLIPNRILIYCLKHDINKRLGTPIRNHIIFPNVEEKKKKRSSELLSSREKVVSKKRSLASEDSSRETAMKAPKRVEKLSSMKEGDSTKKSANRSSGPDPMKRMKVTDTSKKSLNDNKKSVSMKADKSSIADGSRTSLGDQLYSLFRKGSEPAKLKKQDAPDSELERTMTVKPVPRNLSSSQPLLDADSQRRIMVLMKDSTSSITLEGIIQRHKVPSTHAYSSKNVVDKTITQGKVEGAVEALRTALQKLEEGCNIQDAKAVCQPEVLNQIIKWKNKLKVYLAPFLHGMRYTSFGRHFTKVDKLKDIVDKLHWYVQNGDTIVDFCCGSNDFSCLMKKKLEETAKRCSYKNYDVLQPKNDFNYERRDWMTVRPKELPTGSQLIMGLNPPFGVKAALANKFINKALEFNPKLLILIVPQETERLDEKKTPYDLIWEDDEKLSGKSFYLPGSVDVNDKQMDQWNVKPPLLYLWSRCDWTARHKAIAEKHGHLSRKEGAQVPDHPMEEDLGHHGNISMLTDEHTVENDEPGKLKERSAIVTEDHKESSPRYNGDKEGHENHANGKNRSNKKSKKRRRGKGKQGRRSGEISPEDKQNGGRPHHLPSNMTDEISPEDKQNGGRPYHLPSNMTDGRSSLEGYPSKPLERPSHAEVGEEGFRNFQPTVSRSGPQFGAGYGGTGASNPDDIARRYSLNSEEPFSGGMHRWSMGANPGPDYGVRNLEEQFTGYMRDSTDGRGYRPYINNIDGRESDIRSHVQLYGQRDPDSLTQRSSFLAGHDSGFNQVSSLSSTYGHPGLAADSSYNRMNTSAMQRYAPRLDELNHTRVNTLGSEPPMVSRNGMYDPLSPLPTFRADSMGFAPGPRRPFSHQSSSGWLNE